jgi:putative CocE/NonD family hydrolase
MIRTEFPRKVHEVPHTLIPLHDGVRLAARIWLPVDAPERPVPAILEYLPYRKRDGTFERDALTHPYLAGFGYAAVRVDIRGTGESEGLLSDEYSRQELDDALQVIAWLASQTWCTGAVGMMGISWGGFNALQVASLRPRELKAIVTVCSSDDRYRDDVHYMGGTLLKGGIDWGSFLLRAAAHPPDPALVGDGWLPVWRQRLENVPLFLERWMRHQRRDAYWRRGSVCEDYTAIACPVFAVGGWTDGYTNTVPRLLEQLGVPRKGLIGPWAHGYPHIARPGPQIGFLQELVQWWDHWLKGENNGAMDGPMLRVWISDSVLPADEHVELPGKWVAEDSWPPAGTVDFELKLSDEGLRTATARMTPRELRTAQTVGAHSGEWCPFGAGGDQADDQADDDLQSLTFDTEVLDTAMDVLGAPAITLELASDKPVASIVVRLCDVRPSGEVLRVSYGILNLTRRDGFDAPSALVSGRRYRVQLRMNDAGATFPAGHKVRIALSTTYWPLMWPAPEAATITVYSASLRLPTRPAGSLDALLEQMQPVETALPELLTQAPDGTQRIERIGLDIMSEGNARYRIERDDPLSAVAEVRRSDTVARGDWRIRVETELRVSCRSDTFNVQARLRAWHGDAEVCDRAWVESIPRDLM